jgi:hypothetical protein
LRERGCVRIEIDLTEDAITIEWTAAQEMIRSPKISAERQIQKARVAEVVERRDDLSDGHGVDDERRLHFWLGLRLWFWFGLLGFGSLGFELL